MSFGEMLYTLLIGPLQLVFEIIFAVANRMTGHPGIAIIVLSLIMNILVLPLYRRADQMQEEARDIDLKLRDGVSHIKKSFTGDERMMILQTYYRQNHYKPTDALNGSVSLLLEIPFFIAAYQFLSHLEILRGVTLGPIVDLAAPDGLLHIGGVVINLLPIAMTTVNIISSALYLRGFPLKTKIQLYAMALFFLVFLYTSPSGLVFYWTLNNVFSLVKNIFYKIKNPRKVLNFLLSVFGVGVLCWDILGRETITLKGSVVLICISVMCQFPLVYSILKDKKKLGIKIRDKKENDRKKFLLANFFLIIFIGILIPSAVIGASPLEFIDINNYYNPLWYIVNTACLAIGVFFVWMQVFYWLANDSGKIVLDKVAWILCGVSITNYMFYGTELGNLFANLQYENGLDWGLKDELGNFVVLTVIAFVMYFMVKKAPKLCMTVLLSTIIAIMYMAGNNIVTINEQATDLKVKLEEQNTPFPQFNLSKSGKNVIVLMLDRAMSQYVPYIFNEKPELQEKFSGFTYYSNTISYGGYTNFATPALFGGYEYTPIELNKRDTESLESKQNEALKVMPAIFDDNNYEVTVCDPPYAGYDWIPDLSIYEEMPRVQTYITQGRFNSTEAQTELIKNNQRNFFCFSFMKVMPLLLQEAVYDEGRYNQADVNKNDLYTTQIVKSNSESEGISSDFMKQYNVLLNMSDMTKITDEDKNTFLMMSNCTTHEPMLLKEPEYEPSVYVDNLEYDEIHGERFNVDGKKLEMNNSNHMMHYQVNMATFIQLGKWFDYMRKNEVYDNTRIILVADHGRNLGHFEELILDDGSNENFNVEFYYPLLMIKDFNSEEYQESDEFMTNADVPIMAMNGLVNTPINPYTGKVLDNNVKKGDKHFVIASSEYRVYVNNGNTFLPAQWLIFNGKDIWNKENWEIIEEEVLLPME